MNAGLIFVSVNFFRKLRSFAKGDKNQAAIEAPAAASFRK
jgi:hypothetical protein